MRPEYLILDEIFDRLGGVDEVARVVKSEPGTVRCWEQNPEKSGQAIPTNKLRLVLAHTGKKMNDLILQDLVDELLCHYFGPAMRIPYRIQDLERMERVKALANGNGKPTSNRDAPGCPSCGGGLAPDGWAHNGLGLEPIYRCSACHGVGRRK